MNRYNHLCKAAPSVARLILPVLLGAAPLATANTNGGNASFIGAGANNSILGPVNFSLIGAGRDNTINSAANNSVIIGGRFNTIAALANRSTIAGGSTNSIGLASAGSTIVGGDSNTVSPINPALGNSLWATIGGGLNNLVGSNGLAATIGGGQFNEASGRYATVPGGFANEASGTNSFAAGSQAVASNTGTFVWADSSTNTDFASTADNQFLIRANGGVGINTTVTSGNALTVDGNVRITGTLDTGTLAPGAVTADALAAGAVSSWLVVESNSPTMAQPNTKYLLPEDGSGRLTLPAAPPIGSTIQISGQGTLLANADQLIGGIWFRAIEDFQATQVLISGDGRKIVAFNPMSQMDPVTGSNTPPSIAIIETGQSASSQYPVPNSAGVAGAARLCMSDDGNIMYGSFDSDQLPMGSLYRSTNGGQSWEPLAVTNALPNIPPRYESPACSANGNIVYAMGYDSLTASNTIIRSTDSGLTWETTGAPPEGQRFSTTPFDLLVSDDGSVLLTATDSRELLKSTNRGQSWDVLAVTNGLTNVSWLDTESVMMSGDGETIVVRADLNPPNPGTKSFVVSTNGGTTWQVNSARTDVYSVPADPVILTRQGNAIFLTGYTGPPPGTTIVETSTDLGRSWTAVATLNDVGTSSLPGSTGTFAADRSGFRLAMVSSYPGPPVANGLMVRGSSGLNLPLSDSSAELLYRGSGKWTLVSESGTSGTVEP